MASLFEGYRQGNTASVRIWRWWVLLAWGKCDASTLLFPLAEKLLAAAATRRDIHGLVAVSPDLLRASAARIVAQESAIERVRNEAPDYVKALVRDV